MTTLPSSFRTIYNLLRTCSTTANFTVFCTVRSQKVIKTRSNCRCRNPARITRVTPPVLQHHTTVRVQCSQRGGEKHNSQAPQYTRNTLLVIEESTIAGLASTRREGQNSTDEPQRDQPPSESPTRIQHPLVPAVLPKPNPNPKRTKVVSSRVGGNGEQNIIDKGACKEGEICYGGDGVLCVRRNKRKVKPSWMGQYTLMRLLW